MDSPRIRIEVRSSASEIKKLDLVAEHLEKNRSDTVRYLIDRESKRIK